jgi:hypothetical protein
LVVYKIGLRDWWSTRLVVYEIGGLRDVCRRGVGRQQQHFSKFHEVSVYDLSVYELSVYELPWYHLTADVSRTLHAKPLGVSKT